MSITCSRNSRMHHANKHLILEISIWKYFLVEKFKLFVSPPCSIQCPSFASVSFTLIIFLFGPLCCAIFVFGLFCCHVPLTGLIWAPPAILKFFHLYDVDFLLRISRRSSFQMLNQLIFPPRFFCLVFRPFSPHVGFRFYLLSVNISIFPL